MITSINFSILKKGNHRLKRILCENVDSTNYPKKNTYNTYNLILQDEASEAR